MKFSVTRLRVKGVRLPQRNWSREPAVVGDLRTYRILDPVTHAYVERARVGNADSQAPMLPELNDFRLVAIAPLAMLLEGYERVETAKGCIDFKQEWLVRKVD
jgi:hypothetical protein